MIKIKLKPKEPCRIRAARVAWITGKSYAVEENLLG